MFDVLKLGDTGNNVKILQEKLKILGFYNPIITGSFGLSTMEGVKAFQNMVGLDDTGVVDNETWDILYEYTEPAISPISLFPTLRYGSSGSYVEDLQTKLKNLLYYTGEINSNFDLETENAVKRFQLNNKLTSDGIVGDRTWDTLNILYGNLEDCAIENEIKDDTESYTVVKGDTLYAIARKFNTTVDEIKRLNNLTSDVISIGQVLKVPKPSDQTSYSSYTVVKGDTLYAIARKFNTTVNELKSINNLTSDILSIGQILKIPSNTSVDIPTYLNYIVVKNDTLYSIARRYNTTVDEIKRLNNLTSNILSIGQVLKIPT